MKYSVTILLLLLSINTFPQTFTASVSSKSISTTDQLEITFTFSGSSTEGLSDFREPPMSDFTRLYGPNTSTSLQIINGRSTAQQSFSYLVIPKKEGTFTIGSASIKFKGKNYQTSQIVINVVKGRAKNNNENSESIDLSKDVFIKTIVNKKKVYNGEEIVLTYKLYTTRSTAASMEAVKLPAYKDFWAEEIPIEKLQPVEETFNHRVYITAILKKAYLFPNKDGKLKIDPIVVNIPIQVKVKRKSSSRNSFLDEFFDSFTDTKIINYRAESNTETIESMPLPTDPPAGFKGSVGSYSIQVSGDFKNLKQFVPFTLKATISGTGNIKLISEPDLNLPNGLDKYQPKINDSCTYENSLKGYKSFEYTIIPQISGNLIIPPIQFTYFDVQRKEYVTLKTDDIRIDIQQNNKPDNVDDGYLSNDIYQNKKDYSLSSLDNIYIFKVWYWTLFVLIVLTFMGCLYYLRRNSKLFSNKELYKFTIAEKIARKRLKLADKLRLGMNHKEFFNELDIALIKYLTDKFNVNFADYSVKDIVKTAQIKLHNNFNTEELMNLLKDFEFIRFSPAQIETFDMDIYFQRTIEIIKQIEEELSK